MSRDERPRTLRTMTHHQVPRPPTRLCQLDWQFFHSAHVASLVPLCATMVAGLWRQAMAHTLTCSRQETGGQLPVFRKHPRMMLMWVHLACMYILLVDCHSLHFPSLLPW